MKYHISKEEFQAAAISWNDLCLIYKDFAENKNDKYENILQDFTNTYLDLKIFRENREDDKSDKKDRVRVHSVRARVKDPEHLIEKIIRKRRENDDKYKKLDAVNYEKFVTDLIGIRCLILFKEDWISFHRYILSEFENNSQYYVRDSLRDFDDDVKHNYIAEEPKVHIRNGDSREIYDGVLSPDHIIGGKDYRSVHYIIKYKGVYLEIQVRTLFEEGWSEIDHAIVYPYYTKDPMLKEYTQLVNRLSGLADEMGGFFHRLKELEVEHLANRCQEGNKENGTAADVQDEARRSTRTEYPVLKNEEEPIKTPADCLQAVLDQ